jgi:dephospho-CoA kinase
MTFVVGLTGGLGVGKSTVANYFEELGVPIIDADVIAREVVEPDNFAYHQIIARYGDGILDPQKHLNRQQLRDIIFHQPFERLWLEQLLHPEINQAIRKQVQSITAPYCVLVIPLLAENFSDYRDLLNFIIVVDIPPAVQISRIKDRDGTEEALIQKMIQAQAEGRERLAIADTIITNTGDKNALKETVAHLNKQILQSL